MKGILFVCVENKARSQMAEGLARHFLGHQFDIFSAGSHPAPQIDPIVRSVMAEIGVDISKQKPKSLSDIDLTQISLVITLSDDQHCPVISSEIKKQHWEVMDPSGSLLSGLLKLRRYRKLRDDIKKKVLELRSAQQSWQL